MAIASVASTRFDLKTLGRIQGHDDSRPDIYRQVVLALQQIRSQTHNVKYIYILRRTADPNTMAFVADADSL